MLTHPREFKVTRREPGVDWKPWDLSYHSTEAGARKAAEAFLKGEGKNYGFTYRRTNERSAIVSQRRTSSRFTAWDRVARYVVVDGQVVAFGPLQEVS